MFLETRSISFDSTNTTEAFELKQLSVKIILYTSFAVTGYVSQAYEDAHCTITQTMLSGVVVE